MSKLKPYHLRRHRAWIRPTDVSEGGITKDSGFMVEDENIDLDGKQIIDTSGQTYHFSEIILMPSINQVDSEGQEIFDGDIDSEGYIINFITLNLNDPLYGDPNYSRVVRFPSKDGDKPVELELAHLIRIVGNMYENGELLEVAE